MRVIVLCCLSGLFNVWPAGAREAQPGTKLWQFNAPGPVYAAPALAANGDVYVSSAEGKVYALSAGQKRWEFAVNAPSEPTVGEDETIYFSNFSSPRAHVYALNPDGSLKWVIEEPSFSLTPVALGRDGILYVGSNEGILFALSPDGIDKWRGQGGDWILSQVSVSRDDTIYVPFGADFMYTLAFSPGGDILWQGPAPAETPSAIAVGDDNALYFGIGGGMISLNPDGTERWTLPLEGFNEFNQSPPIIDREGTIYIVSSRQRLYAIDAGGTQRWKLESGDLSAEPGSLGDPAVARDGALYLGAGNKLVALNRDRTVEWEFVTAGALGPPVIGPKGAVYFVTADHRVYAVQGKAPPAHNGWPMYRHDAQGTGNAGHRSPNHE